MKSACTLELLLKILVFVSCFLSTSSLATEYFLIPGYIKSGSREGGEITFAMNGRYKLNMAAYEGNGIVLGAWSGPKKEASVEIQHHVHGYFVFSYSGGVGAYRSTSSHGLQATVSIQYWTPFLMFVREQVQTFPVVVAKKPQFGLMFKLPIPLPGSRP